MKAGTQVTSLWAKVLSVTIKVVVGILVFYLLAGLVIVPLVLPWAIRSQGTRILRHPVEVRSVTFNPFLWRLEIRGVKVLDADKQVMVGFDRLATDISFLGLLRKEYRVESVRLEGWQVNVALLPGNRVSLLELVPVAAQGPAPVAQPVATSSSSSVPPKLPLVVVDDIVLSQGSVRFVDHTITPRFATAVSSIDIHVTGLSTRPDCRARIDLQAKIDEKGVVTHTAEVMPFAQPLQMETSFELNGYALDVLTPYVGKYTGRALKDGRLGFRMDYRIADNKLTASHKVLIQRFAFGQKVESRDALPLPFGLAVALLEDAQGRINISLPVTGDMSKPDFHYWQLVGQVVRNFFMGLVTKPFSFLASALGAESGTDELGYVRFLPGKNDLSDEERARLQALIKGMRAHPRLLLQINGGYDPAVDWPAIKKEVLARDYQELRSHSTRSDCELYQMLYQRRFGIRDLWAVTKKFKVKEGEYKEEDLTAELKRQLIESGEPDTGALHALALARAQAIYDRLIADGMDSGRLRLGPVSTSQASLGVVPCEFTLTVFEDPAAPPAAGQ